MTGNGIDFLSLVFILTLNNGVTNGNLTFYGNEIKARSTSGMNQGIVNPSGPRIWIDDPLNGDSWPQWGYLQSYHIYIQGAGSVPLPTLYLQIWTNMSAINNYTLKWQKKLENYQTERAYQIAPDPGTVVEVSNYDRIGFSSDGSGSPVALDPETDATGTASTAHRTYFRLLSRDNFRLPNVGDIRMVDNNALRGRFSIGVTLDKAPPRQATEVYAGFELIRSANVGSFGLTPIMDNSIVFPTGRLTAFYFRLSQISSPTSVRMHVWQQVPGSKTSYILAYTRSLNIGIGPEKTFNLSITDGPLVNGNFRLGWISDKIFFTSGSGSCYQYAGADIPSEVGKTYTFDNLAYIYRASHGIIVDVQLSGTTQSVPTPEISKSVPTSVISKSVPTSVIRESVPTSVISKSVPTSVISKSVPTSVIIESVPTSVISKSVPTSQINQLVPTVEINTGPGINEAAVHNNGFNPTITSPMSYMVGLLIAICVVYFICYD